MVFEYNLIIWKYFKKNMSKHRFVYYNVLAEKYFKKTTIVERFLIQ